MVIELYYHPQSPPSQTVWMVLKELGLEYKENVVDMKDVKTEKYLAINPFGKIPAIRDGDLCVAESRAIAIYLCTKYERSNKEKKLYPTDQTEIAMFNMNMFADIDGFYNVHKYGNVPAVFKGTGRQLDEYLPTVKATLSDMERRLKANKFLGGDHVTLIDYFACSTTGVLGMTDFNSWNDFPHVQEWEKAMCDLPYFEECHVKPFELSRKLYQSQIVKFAAKP